jgi:uncharacterized lipoprotein NlpE involved in copper resistance
LKKILTTLLLLVFFGGCAAYDTHHNARNSLDYEGVYVGTIPCADCEGIRTVIRILPNQYYEKEQVYLGKSFDTYASKGSFKWHPNGSIVWFDDGSSFFIGENHLLMLDSNDNKIEGPLKDRYKLEKFGVQYVLPEDTSGAF